MAVIMDKPCRKRSLVGRLPSGKQYNFFQVDIMFCFEIKMLLVAKIIAAAIHMSFVLPANNHVEKISSG